MFSEIFDGSTATAETIIRLRDSACAIDSFIAAVGWLDLFTRLADEPADLPTICRELSIAERPTGTLLTLLEAWGFLERDASGAYRTSPVARRHLNTRSPLDFSPYVAVLRERPGVKELYDILKHDRPATWHTQNTADKLLWDDSMRDERFAEAFTASMDTRGNIFAPVVAELLDCTGYNRLLDIAGGSGVYTAHLLQRYPGLTGTVLERPPVDAVARRGLAKRGVTADRASVLAGDMFADPFPRGYDLHLFSHVTLDWPVDKVALLMRKSFETLAPGGTVAVFASHLNDLGDSGPPAAPMAEYSVYMTFYFEGRCYGIGETQDMLREAGFVDTDWTPAISGRSLIRARKPVEARTGAPAPAAAAARS
jgi:hypothetical protein